MNSTITNEVRWGIIGTGNVCEVKSGPALQLAKNSKLVAVMRRDSEKAKDFATRHQVPKWYDKAEVLINDPQVNAIYIATPPSTHKKYTLLAANAGKPVYVEKPMARKYEECLSMIKACKEANVKLFVAYYRRALPNILKIKEIIESGIIGEVSLVNVGILKPFSLENEKDSNWRVQPEISGGGYFYDLASHQFDALDFIFGPIEFAQGMAVNQAGHYAAEDLTIASFKFKNGILGQGVWAFNTSSESEQELTTIIGNKGEISFSFFGDHSVQVKVENKPKQVYKFNISKYIQTPLIQTIVNDLLKKGKCQSTGVSAARTNWVMDQIHKGAE